MKAEEIKTLTDAQRFVEDVLRALSRGFINDERASSMMGDYTERMLQMGAEMYKQAKEK